jgi:outer membrane biosynthesis protein TonB
LYSNLRFVASASLVAVASLIGVLALFPDALEELLVAGTEISDPPVAACQQQDWWQLDRSCLSRRGMPWAAGPQGSSAVTVEVPSAAEGAPEQPLTENRSAATAPVETARPNEAAAPVAEERQIAKPQSEATQQPETPAPPPVAEERHIPTQRSEVAAPQQDTPAPPPVAVERHTAKQRSEVVASRPETPPPAAQGRRAAKPAVEAQPRAGAAKKAASGDRAAKQRPTNEALNAVRRFQDNLRDIPVSAYAADGTRRTIVIRPTSIQDVYYYSAPR